MTNEDRQSEQERESLVQEMLRDAKTAEMPSDLKTHPIIHSGDGTLEAPMTVKEISGAGYVWVWDTRTYDQIPVLSYMLPSKLRSRRPDGSFRFTTVNPGKLPKRGTVKCFLHPGSDNRKHYDELGFRVCNKSNITNQYQLQQHMKKKHPQEWEAIEQERAATERREDRELQQLLIKGVTGKAQSEATADPLPEAPLYISEKPVKKAKVK
uniref:Uncharacterized protein n=1 Tax=viral metagenome TaxID=1070528 RepID=A0A6M3LQ40_9ZZZZ